MKGSIESIILWGLMAVIAFFMMLGFYAGLNGVIPSTNIYGIWLPVFIFFIFLAMVLIGYSKAKKGEFFTGRTD